MKHKLLTAIMVDSVLFYVCIVYICIAWGIRYALNRPTLPAEATSPALDTNTYDFGSTFAFEVNYWYLDSNSIADPFTIILDGVRKQFTHEDFKKRLGFVNKPTFEDLLDAIEWVESSGDSNAVGSCGGVGLYQISKTYLDDINRICLNKGGPIIYFYPLESRRDPILSRHIVKIYLEHYATKERLGHEPTFEDMARIHNGGPRGYEKEATKPYWDKVKARMSGERK